VFHLVEPTGSLHRVDANYKSMVVTDTENKSTNKNALFCDATVKMMSC
jgi:hypothetical protein